MSFSWSPEAREAAAKALCDAGNGVDPLNDADPALDAVLPFVQRALDEARCHVVEGDAVTVATDTLIDARDVVPDSREEWKLAAVTEADAHDASLRELNAAGRRIAEAARDAVCAANRVIAASRPGHRDKFDAALTELDSASDLLGSARESSPWKEASE